MFKELIVTDSTTFWSFVFDFLISLEKVLGPDYEISLFVHGYIHVCFTISEPVRSSFTDHSIPVQYIFTFTIHFVCHSLRAVSQVWLNHLRLNFLLYLYCLNRQFSPNVLLEIVYMCLEIKSISSLADTISSTVLHKHTNIVWLHYSVNWPQIEL